MTIVRVGATKKYSDGWESAFGQGKKKAAGKTSAAKASTRKKSTAKKTKRK